MQPYTLPLLITYAEHTIISTVLSMGEEIIQGLYYKFLHITNCHTLTKTLTCTEHPDIRFWRRDSRVLCKVLLSVVAMHLLHEET